MSTLATDDVVFAGAAGQASLLETGAISSAELVDTCLRRIERADQELNCFRVVRYAAALEEAEAADRERAAGSDKPLLGIPLAVKDDLHVRGEPTALGAAANGHRAVRDSEAVRRLRAAGAVVVGKTNMPELGAWPFTEGASWGETRNPWDPSRTPGGSSGGSAAAVAAGLAGAALGSDGGGSIRIPAAACGVFGLKPQRGRIPIEPHQEWHGLCVVGPLARTVVDAALVYDAVADGTPGDMALEAAVTRPGRLRIAWSSKPPLPCTVTDDVREAVEETAALLARLGHSVEQRDPGYTAISYAHTVPYFAGMHAEAALLQRQGLEPRTRSLVRAGALCEALVPTALRVAAAQARRLTRLFHEFDVLLTPVVPGPPPEVGRWRGRGALRTLLGVGRAWPPFTLPWNLTGQPAASVPAGFDAEGLPLGVQLVGRPDAETTLVALAAQVEGERDWAVQTPPTQL